MGQLWSMKPLNVDFEIPAVPALPGDTAMASGFCPSVSDIVWCWSQQAKLILQGPNPPLVCHTEMCLWWLCWEHQSHHWGGSAVASVWLLIYWAAILTKTERVMVLHAMCIPTLKEFLVQDACHGYWTTFLDIERLGFCEKHNSNLEMDFF